MMSTAVRRFSIRVSGRVQGVFFRASTAEKANELGIRGFVRNEDDGSVYIEAEGGEEELQTFVAWCRSGPPRARVYACDVEEGEVKNFRDFKIQR